MYAVAAAVQRGLVFLLLPVYTRALDPVAYGRLSILLAIAAAVVIVLSIGMDTAFFRVYFGLRDDPATQRRFVTTAWVFLIVAAPVGAGVLALVSAPLLLDSATVPAGELALTLAGAALFVSATVVPLALLRAEERLRDYLALTAVIAATTAGFTFFAVVVLDAGVRGWFISVIAANAVTLLVAVKIIPLRLAHGIDRKLLTGALALGLPLIPHMLSHWGLGVSNRLVLAGMVTPFEVGIYALATNIALPVAILMAGMAQGFMPAYARAATETAALQALPRLINAQFLLVLALATGAMLIGPIAVHYLAPPEYADAARLVPWMTAGYGLLGLYFLPMNALSLTAGRTGKVWLVTLVAAGANFGALLLLEPALGLLGAAIAVTVGYAVLLVGVALYSRGPDNPVRYQLPRLARATVVFVIIYAFAVTTTDAVTARDALLRLACLTAALPLLVLARVVDRGHLVALVARTPSKRRG